MTVAEFFFVFVMRALLDLIVSEVYG